jgi:cob(I)alamin adenosyltransferase
LTGVRIYTRRGDDGSTGLLYGGRIAKDDLRADVYGTLDETVACLGMARAAGLVARADEIARRLQREMFVVGAQLATSADNQPKLVAGVSRVTPEMTEHAERDIDELVAEHPLPAEFVLPGATLGSAALDLARSTLRRAERGTVALQRSRGLPDAEILRYLNRASDLLFALARYEEAARGRHPEPSRAR